MFRIGDFARFTRVSVRMLRHYDRLGLLRPAAVDARTRYRWYSARQLPRLQRILALRELGFPLEHIASMLEQDRGGGAFRRLLERRRDQLAHEIDETGRRLAQIEAELGTLVKRPAAPLPDVVVRSVAPVRVAARRERVDDLEGAVESLFDELEAEVAKARARAAGPPVLVYHDRDGRTADVDVEAAVPVTAEARWAGRATIGVLPGIEQAASTTYVGGYGKWWRVAEGLMRALEARRLTPAGPLREVFVQFGAREARRLGLPRAYLADRAEDFVTEMQIPVRAARGNG